MRISILNSDIVIKFHGTLLKIALKFRL